MHETEPFDRPEEGDESALARLMRAHVRRIRGVIALNLPLPDQIDELTQETFVYAFENMAKFKPGSDFSAWLGAIARNLVRAAIQRHVRELSNRRKYTRWYLMEKASDELDRGRWLELEWLERCRQRLSGTARRLLQMKYDLGLSGAAIAGELHRTSEWVWTTLSRIREGLKICIEDQRRANQE